MTVYRRLVPVVVVSFLVVGCAASPPATSRPKRESGASAASGPSAMPVPSLGGARRVAGEWVAATGELLAMGPIARGEFIRARVASASADVMAENLDADLSGLAAGLPMPVSELRLVETPITIDAAINPTAGDATVQVWSVVVFGAAILGPPRVLFRTSRIDLTVAAGGWKLTSFTSTPGPTPVATDASPADWDSFVTVAAWPAAVGEG